MASRYDERNYRGSERSGRQSDRNYETAGDRYRYDDEEGRMEYGRSRGQDYDQDYGDRYSSRQFGGYGSRGQYGGNWSSEQPYSERSYGGNRRRSDEDDDRYNYSWSGYSSANKPQRYRSEETYGEPSRAFDYERNRYERDYSDRGQNRGWWDRASDEVASWFGDEDAERRRRRDQERQYRGRGPKNYRRSDERIKEDVNDRLSEGYLDASDIEVTVANAEVTLTGNVNSRRDKRMAESIAETVSGVTNVENRLRVKVDQNRYNETNLTDTNTTSTNTSTSTFTGRGKAVGS